MTWDDLSKRFDRLDQALCIVNLKKHARDFFRLLKQRWDADVFHLSTAMCPKHRAAVLADVNARLKDKRRCALVATQCVEAGVDLDFPAVFRAMGPLDSIAQAAGRCNRNGGIEAGELCVFVPEDEKYPPGGGYQQGADITKVLLKEPRKPSIDNPADFERYFRSLYGIAKLEQGPLFDAIWSKRFVEVRKEYRVIDQDTVNVLVAYDPEIYRSLAEEARAKGLSRDWVRRARPYSVGCFLREVENAVEPVSVRVRGGKLIESGDWFLYLRDHHYDPDVGLAIPKELEFLEG